MCKRVTLTLALISLSGATAAFAADAPAASKLEEAKKAPDAKEKLICTREIPVGSTIAKRTCRTAAQVEQDRADARKMREQTGSAATSIIPR